MSFLAALGLIIGTPGAAGWGALAGTLALAFLILLWDGATYVREGQVAVTITGGVLATAALGIITWWLFVSDLLLTHGLTAAHVIAALVWGLIIFVLAAVSAGAGAKAGAALRHRDQS